MGWMIHQAEAKLVYSPERYEIDLRTISGRDDVKAALADLEREPFATPAVVDEAEQLLVNYLIWLRAQDRAKKLRSM
jgi:hypothetical protein